MVWKSLRWLFHLAVQAWLVEWCRDGHSGSFSFLHKPTVEFCQSDFELLDHLPYNGPLTPSAGSKLLPEASVLIGTFNAAEMFPPPRSVPWFNPVSEVGTQLVGLHGLVCALICTVNYGALDRCGIQSAVFITSHVTLHRLSVETELSWPQVWVS